VTADDLQVGADTEAETIAAILRGETYRFHDLIRPYEKTVYLMVLSRVQNEADAEDVVQEAFLKAFRYLATFRAESKFSTWVISIALNEAKSRIRKRAAVKFDTLDADPEEDGHVSPALLRDWREIPSEALERREVRQILQKAVAELPTIYREIFLLRDVEELSTNEAAETLGISVASVKVRLHRARIMLQKTLVPQLKQTSQKRRWLPWL
jgi:RNA polymerase sigma-70 factor, ECF subfamily